MQYAFVLFPRFPTLHGAAGYGELLSSYLNAGHCSYFPQLSLKQEQYCWRHSLAKNKSVFSVFVMIYGSGMALIQIKFSAQVHEAATGQQQHNVRVDEL